ncbi:MAG: flavin reductase [Treponemataceae bacterium]
MEQKALFNIPYGVFILGANSDGKINACVTNTCIQVASDPVRIAISVLNRNLTCQMIKKSGTFSLSILDKDCTFETIKHFGFQSGKDLNKFESFPFLKDENGNPYLKNQICTLICAKVLSAQDLGTHTLFVAEIQDAKVMSSKEPITYSDYQNKIKPKPEAESGKKIVGWRCKICGYEHDEPELPEDFLCPLCMHPVDDFEPIYE